MSKEKSGDETPEQFSQSNPVKAERAARFYYSLSIQTANKGMVYESTLFFKTAEKISESPGKTTSGDKNTSVDLPTSADLFISSSDVAAADSNIETP